VEGELRSNAKRLHKKVKGPLKVMKPKCLTQAFRKMIKGKNWPNMELLDLADINGKEKMEAEANICGTLWCLLRKKKKRESSLRRDKTKLKRVPCKN